MTAAANGAFSLVTTDTAAAAANIQITADGTVDIDSAGVLTLDSGAAINIEPAACSAILLDGTISIDAGVVTGATSITSTHYVTGNNGTVKFLDGDGNKYFTLAAHACTTACIAYTFPPAGGSCGNVLTTNGSGVLSWGSAGGQTINNATANELVTIGATTTELCAEANLLFDGQNFTHQYAGQQNFNIASYSTTNSTNALLNIQKSDNGSVGTQTALDCAENIGSLQFQGSNGTLFVTGANIVARSIEAWCSNRGTALDVNVVKAGATALTTVMTLNGCDVGIGTTSPAMRLHLEGADGDYQLKIKMTHDSSDYGINMEGTGNNVGATARFVSFKMNNDAGDEDKFAVEVNGDVLSRTNSYGAFSDAAVKRNIAIPSAAMPELQKLKIKEFEYVATPCETQRGIIAQCVVADGVNIPSFITTVPDRHVNNQGESEEVETYAASYNRLIPWLVQAVQELQGCIDNLKS